MQFLLPILNALEGANIDYVVVGGVAVVLRGHPRLTVDLDLVLEMGSENARRAIEVLQQLGLRPRIAEPAEAFCNPRKREEWAEKGMLVFSMVNPSNPLVSVDLFVESPVPYDELRKRASRIEVGLSSVPVASVEDLIAMKRVSGRAVDAEDVVALEEIAPND